MSKVTVEERLLRLENVFNSAPVGLCFIAVDFRYVTVNQCFAEMYELSREDFIGRTVREVLPAVADQIMAHLEQSLATESQVSVELTFTRHLPGLSEPRSFVYLRSAQPMRDTLGAITGFSVAVVDISARKAAEAALQESEDNLRYTVELNPHVPWSIEANGTSVKLGKGFTALTGLAHEELTARQWGDAIHVEDREEVWAAWQHSLKTGAPFDRSYRMHCRDGHYRWMRSRAFPRRDLEGQVVRWYGTLEDVHERTLLDDALRNKTARLEEVSAQLSLRVREDHLTGLANRRHFDDALGREMTRARRSRHPLALVMLDVDYFKRYNDTFGHPAGDICLRDVAQALKSALRRQGDLAARYGGEEFVLLLPDTHEEGSLEVAQYASEAVRALGIRHPLSDTGFVTLSAGVANFSPDHHFPHQDSTEFLLQAADVALYAAKSAGRNCVVSGRDLARSANVKVLACQSAEK